jgi:hypothetical protein
MPEFKIPVSFEVGGKTYKVIFDEDLSHEKNKHGECWPARTLIKLQDGTKGEKLSQDYVNETFCHELVHVILDEAGREDLSRNEKIVTPCGLILYQILKTMKFE